MNVAAIDIGTNTVLLLLARIDGDGTITPLLEAQSIPRLGTGVDATRTLNSGAMNRVVGVLEDYLHRIAPFHPDVTTACATSAVRDASNREEFVAMVHSRTGLAVEVLTGEEEALWTYRGAVSGLPRIGAATVLDIGGGSTEITAGVGEAVHRHCSLEVGAVRLTERWFRHDPPTPEEVARAAGNVREELARAQEFAVAGTTLIGVAGTATALAILHQGLARFDIQAVINYCLGLDAVGALLATLQSKSAAQIRSLSGVMEGRADVITAGAVILREVMVQYGFPAVTVSERGVRYGLALRAWMRRTV